MKFDVLRLSGFKSFVDHTEIPLSPGLTGIVGPNGCGKSNVLEAMRWVMGESSAKSMRGSGMEDVIFAGAATRPPKNFAEVSLMIDNSAQHAPAPFTAEPTVDISRRITRNAGSAYRVNGKEVRARDVKVLFADAATGAQSPSLVRQGQISLLIAAKPTGRRRLLEDAAGVSGLYERRREVEQRLKAADENLGRIDDVLQRLESQISSLTKQARQAEKYGTLSALIREATAELAWRRHRAATIAEETAREALDAATRLVAASTADHSACERKKSEAEETLPALREEEVIARALHQKLLSRREALEADARRARDQQAKLDRALEQARNDLQRETELDRDARSALEALAKEKGELQSRATAESRLEAAAQLFATAESDLHVAEEKRDTMAAAAAAGQAARAAEEINLKRAQDALTSVKKQLGECEARRATRTKSLDEAQAKTTASEGAVKESASAQNTALETQKNAAEALAATDAKLTQAKSDKASAKARYDALSAEAQTLRKALEADEKAVPQAALINSITVEPGYEAALSAALGADGRASETGEFDPERQGWLPLGSIEKPEVPATPLSKFVKAPSALLRWLSSVFVVSREQGAALQPKLLRGVSLVSVEGDFWRWDGYFSGGELGTANALAAPLERRNRLEELDAQLPEASSETEQANQALRDAHEKHANSERADREARTEAKRADDSAAAAVRSKDDALAAVERAREALDNDADLFERLKGELSNAEAKTAEAQNSFDQIEDTAALVAAAAAATEALNEARRTRDTKRAEHESLRSEERQRADRIEAIAREESTWTSRAGKTEQRAKELNTRLASIEEERETARDAPEKVAEHLTELKQEETQIEARLTAALDSLSKAEGESKSANAAWNEAAKSLSSAREALARTETTLAAATERTEDTLTLLQDETDSTPDELAERFLDTAEVEVSIVEQRLQKARADRERLGAVNLRASDEISEAETEREGLASEKEDLEEAIAKLRSGLAALNREGRTRLMEAFDIVNANFSALFTHLFGGGEASLQLTESDDPLEAGLEIICQPPGKRVQTLSLMSGGEQTLTALALIFAVFLVNAAPVCVLDEVDAPLDDANVGRFCDLLNEMTRRTEARFIVITHHALTMSRMDRLFGVTMIERGVSRLVSVDLEKAVELIDAA